MGLIIYIIGIVATIYAILDLVKKNISTPCKLLIIIVLLLTSWIGLIIYFLYAKDHVEEWCKQWGDSKIYETLFTNLRRVPREK